MAVSPIALFQKDPDATLDYAIDWTSWLKGDAIQSSAWTVPAGLGSSGAVVGGSMVGIFLSGGVDGTTYDVVNQVTTQGGRIDKRTIRIQVVKR